MKIDATDLNFLKQMTRDVVEASRVRLGQRVGTSPPNTTGQILIRPGGRDCYPAMWVRDFSMSLDCGVISVQETQEHLRLIARKQAMADRRLKSGAIIPTFSIPDHINFDGSSVFYPGTYSAGEDQGGEPFGVLPPADDHYEYIHIAYYLHKHGGHEFAEAPGGRMDLRESLVRAFDAVQTSDATGGMVTTTADRRAVGYGFYDAIYLTGSILFASLLRYRAALELAEMLKMDRYKQIAQSIQSHLAPIFSDPASGWLLAATDVGRQPDVWGTLFALHLSALPDGVAKKSRDTIADAIRRGTITHEGAVRHIPTDRDFSPTSAWQKTAPGVAVNTYQNGAYWHTPTGWLISALHQSHPDIAAAVLKHYIAHLRDNDFRNAPAQGGPWECFGKDHQHQQNAVYMASVTVPLACIQQLEAK